MNLNVTMQRLVLGGAWVHRRLKAIRFHLIHITGQLADHARPLIVRVHGHALEELGRLRSRILALAAPARG